MKIKDNGEPIVNNILDEFDLALETESHVPFTVINKGRQLTLHIMPAAYTDKISLQHAKQQGLFASMNIKKIMESAIGGYEVDVAAEALKKMDFKVESAAEISFAYFLLAKNVKEFAELTTEQLMSKGLTSREAFVEKLLDANATEQLYNAIMGLGKRKQDEHEDKVFDIGDAVKN